MKICPECECKNTDTATLCKDCGVLLSKVAIESYEERVRHEAAVREKQERKRRTKRAVAAATVGIVALILAVSGFVRFGAEFIAAFLLGLLSIGLGCAGLMFPDEMFRLNHMCSIRNIQDVEPSDFYYFGNALGSVGCIIMGLWLLFAGTFIW